MPSDLTPEDAKQLLLFRLAMREVEHRLLRALVPRDQIRLRELLERCLESLKYAHGSPEPDAGSTTRCPAHSA